MARQATWTRAPSPPSARSIVAAYQSTNWMTPPSCTRVVGPGSNAGERTPTLVFLDDAAVLVVGGDPDLGEVVEIVVDALDRIGV